MSIEKEDRTWANNGHDDASEIDLYSFHERHAGRLIIDPAYVFPPFPTIITKIMKLTYLARPR